MALFRDLPVTFDVKNQARVHLWYAKKYGWSIPPYASAEAAIDTWLLVTAVGVRKTGGRFMVYAPYGLNDLLTMTVRPNKLLFTEERYLAKTARWRQQWPQLTVLPWETGDRDATCRRRAE